MKIARAVSYFTLALPLLKRKRPSRIALQHNDEFDAVIGQALPGVCPFDLRRGIGGKGLRHIGKRSGRDGEKRDDSGSAYCVQFLVDFRAGTANPVTRGNARVTAVRHLLVVAQRFRQRRDVGLRE